MKALDIIQAEHRGMWRVCSAMDALAQTLERPAGRLAAARAIAAMLDYIDSYVDRVHHPKEDQHLFSAIRRRADGIDLVPVLDKLEQEHREGPRHRDQLRQEVLGLISARSTDVPVLVEHVALFTEHLRAHIRQEEVQVMPEARKMLRAEDWKAIDAAFLDNDDPLFGERVRSEFEELKARIIAITPAPVGLGGAAVEPAAPVGEAAGEIVLQLRGITSHYGRIQALHGIDLDVRQGQLVALVGANGAGKTTLLRTISGVQPASGGTIELYGRNITRMAPDKRVRHGICQVPEGRQVFGPMSIEDNLRLGAYTRRDGEIALDLERMYGLFPILKEKRMLAAGTLSGGQQQMLAMARALMGRPRLLLLDEPSMGLAPLLVEEIFRVVRRLKADGITIFLVEQNAQAALAIADIAYVIETGHTILSGPGAELLDNEQVKAAYLGM